MIIETKNFKDVNRAPYNPRIELKAGMPEYEKLKKSIEEFGHVLPMVFNKRSGNLVGGHQTMTVLEADNITQAQMSIVDMDDANEKALNIALNKIGGAWEDGKLSELLGELSALPDFDIELTGFDVDEVAALNPAEVVEDNFDAGAALDAIDEPVTQRGDLIILGKHRLLCGDSTDAGDVERLMDGKKADVVFTDPPYGIDVVANSPRLQEDKKLGSIGGSVLAKVGKYSPVIGDETTETAEKAHTIIKDFAKDFIYWGGNYFTHFLPPSRGWIIWNKRNGDTTFADAELAWTSIDKSVRLYDWLWSGMRRQGDRKTEGKLRYHPTQKPVGLQGAIIVDWCKGESIVDLFGGAGSLLIACEQLDRICYMMELDSKYCDVIISRWEEFTNQKAIRPEHQPLEKH